MKISDVITQPTTQTFANIAKELRGGDDNLIK